LFFSFFLFRYSADDKHKKIRIEREKTIDF